MIRIAHVVVHPDGAMVHRRGVCEAVDGEVRIDGLPLLLDVQTLRVAVEGGTLHEQRLDLDVAPPEARTDGPHDALRDARAEAARLDARAGALHAERDRLATLGPSFVDDIDPPTAEALEAWARADDALDPWADRLDADLRRVRRDREALGERIARLEREVAEASDSGWWARWVPRQRLVLRVEAEEPVEVTLSYRMPGATWSPAYGLACTADLTEARFALRAQVVQATGEDWEGVRLAVSTAPCRRRVDLPKLPALRLGTHQAPATPAWRPLPEGLEALFPEAPAPPRPPPPPEAPAPAPMLAAAAPMPQRTRVGAPAPKRAAPRRQAVAAAPPPGAPLPQAPPEPASEGVQADPAHLAFDRLRVAGPDAPRGVRGTLQPVDDDAWLAERGVPPEGRRRYRERLRADRAASARATGRARPPHHVVPGPIEGADSRFEADGEVHLPSDGRHHSVALFDAPLALTTRYVAVPRHDSKVYRRVTAALDRSEPLLPGPVDVRVGGRLELTTPWSGAAHAGALVLELGVEDRIELARNVRYQEETAGLFGGRRRLRTEIEVELASAMGHDVQVELMERLPVPAAGAEVEVALDEATPRAVPWEGPPDGPLREGLHRQRVELPAGGRTVARLAYTVTLSSRDELVGGDRRG